MESSKVIVRIIYKIFRSILFSVTLLVVGLYVLTYTLLSIPAFTNWAKDLATRQLSEFLGGEVTIEDFDIYPFSEVKITNLQVFDPQGDRCLKVQTIGAGINLWKLISEAKIDLTFGEIIGMEADIVQAEKDSPLNIDFIIKAFSPKNENNEKKPFELSLRNVVLRKSSVSFQRPWIKDKHIGSIDLGNLQIDDLAADISFPKISDKEIEIDLRRMSLNIIDAVQLEKLGFKAKIGPDGFFVSDFIFELPGSRIALPELSLPIEKGKMLADAIKERSHYIELSDSYITPSDLAFLYPPLENFSEKIYLDISAIINTESAEIQNLTFYNLDLLTFSIKGAIDNLQNTSNLSADISEFSLEIKETAYTQVHKAFPKIPNKVTQMLPKLGNLKMAGEFAGNLAKSSVNGHLDIESDTFEITIEGNLNNFKNQSFSAEGEVNISDLRLHHLMPEVPIENVNLDLIAEGKKKGKLIEGMASLVVEDFSYKGKKYDGFSINLNKEEDLINGDILINNVIAEIEGKFSGDIEGEVKNLTLDMDINELNLSDLVDMKKFHDYILSGNIKSNVEGSDIDNLTGFLNLSNFNFRAPDNSKHLSLRHFNIEANQQDSTKSINLASDWFDMRVEGEFKYREISEQLISLANSVFPAFVDSRNEMEDFSTSNLEFDMILKKNNSLPEFFNLPFRFLVPVNISGTLQGSDSSASLTIDVPYLQQGKDKLIYDSKIVADINGHDGILNALISTTMPVKKGDLALNLSIFGKDNGLSTDVYWINTENSDFKGHLVLDTEFSKNHLSKTPVIDLIIQPSILQMGPAEWNIARSNINYSEEGIRVTGLKLWHDKQFVEVEGIASANYSDVMKVSLEDIDVDYIFNMLQINYVTFGGVATGEIAGHSLLSSSPVAETEGILIKEFTYNGCNLGECFATSRWNNTEKEIEIAAQISDKGKDLVNASGGIWLGRDSLSFDIAASKVPVDFVQPFMAVFSSHVGGYATGDVKFFGTFHDIDMTGKIFADSVAVKLDYTNTIYHGSDSVFLNPGQIEIPNFRLYDKFGNSALLTGELTHRYFHDPSFTFRLADADNFLCYDTNSELNPDWYGTLFGTGSALLKGVPGIVDISADMTVSGNSIFTFVLNDTQYAQDYQFLTFSDKHKQEEVRSVLTADDFKSMLKKSMAADEGGLSKFGIDIRASVTPQVLFTLVMDPAAGDKITARGQGALQVKYESDNDEMMMYGKYEIQEGNYNFSLQDIILRDFKIKEGSYISFNGNPLAADLDISATYRVNTNLSDLDKSFSTDRDLNRTNVPVDAVLSVNGNMQQPDITFDIELPTLTQDVERKVKSIISTEDMMNRQIIYLLALNRFYTPEYMGSSGNGGELAAVASSTISSQLSNILGQLTDKFSVSPSFRSDKGDFSDIEVDVALSSKLLNNRLLINGNFGYRDRSNSSTTFVGDFDVEYLLSKNGNLRLKAYNHFNDQNYYLREALTTQGLGIIYRRDFDHWLSFLKKKDKPIEDNEKDSVEENKEMQTEEKEYQGNGTQD